MVVVALIFVNLGRLREFLKIPFLVYSRLREVPVGDRQGGREAAILLLLIHIVSDLLVSALA